MNRQGKYDTLNRNNSNWGGKSFLILGADIFKLHYKIKRSH